MIIPPFSGMKDDLKSSPAKPVPSTSQINVSEDTPTTKRLRPVSYTELAGCDSDFEVSENEKEECPFELSIQTMIRNGMKPRGIMATLNSVIIDLKLEENFLSVNKVKDRIDQLYKEAIDDHNSETQNLTYLSKFSCHLVI